MLSEDDYSRLIEKISANEILENIHPSCARKLIELNIRFAEGLGFKPQKDYKITRQLLEDIDPTACPKQYKFGKDGKPFYVSGPTENLDQVRKIVDTLDRGCGKNNFHYIISGIDVAEF